LLFRWGGGRTPFGVPLANGARKLWRLCCCFAKGAYGYKKFCLALGEFSRGLVPSARPGLHEGIRKVITSGWEITSIAVVQSGTPFWVINNLPLTAGGDYNADGVAFDVPDAPGQNFTGSHSRQQYMSGLFVASDFPAPTAGTEGTEKRNIYRNPGLVQVDASMLKNSHPVARGAGQLAVPL
jgi:hypothetical protein